MEKNNKPKGLKKICLNLSNSKTLDLEVILIIEKSEVIKEGISWSWIIQYINADSKAKLLDSAKKLRNCSN
jgi:hypothetical protein